MKAVIFSFGTYRNLGPYRIASELRKLNHSCQVISMIDRFSIDDLELLGKKFIDEDTTIVAFSTVFWQPECNDSYKKIRKLINELNPNAKIILGGNRAKEVSKITSDKTDAIITGQGESLIIKYIASLTSSYVMQEPNEVFNNIPVYNAEKIAHDWDFGTSKTVYAPEDCIFYGEPQVLEISRGCVFRCKFCAFPLNGKKKNDFSREADMLREELIDNYNNYGITHYLLSDDTFNDSTEKIEYIRDIFKTLPFKLTFTTFARLDLIHAHRTQIDILEEMGLVGVQFGVESFHDKAAKTVGKGMSSKTTKSFLHELKTKYWKDRVKVAISIIAGLPHETHESYDETIKWIAQEDNLVEDVKIYRLGICDPVRCELPFQSEFQLSASKYGFYWPDKNDPWMWKNMIGPVKTRQEADIITQRIQNSINTVGRNLGNGGFKMSFTTIVADHGKNPKTIDDFVKMDRFEFKSWCENNEEYSYNQYLNNYKQALLKL